MNDTKSKLNGLLSYWLGHSQEHGAEFREWADKIAVDQNDVAAQLRLAADKMTEADDCLKKARALLR